MPLVGPANNIELAQFFVAVEKHNLIIGYMLMQDDLKFDILLIYIYQIYMEG